MNPDPPNSADAPEPQPPNPPVVLARPIGLAYAPPPPPGANPLLLQPISPWNAGLDAGLILMVTLGLPLVAALLTFGAATPETAPAAPEPVSALGKWIDAGVMCGLAAYLCLRHRLPAASVGLRFDGIAWQSLWGLATMAGCYGWMIASVIIITPIAALMPWLQQDLLHREEMFQLIPMGDPWAQVVLLIAVVIHEELWFRGLLLTYARRLTGSWWIAVPATSLLFGMLHLPQGFIGALQVAGLSVVLSLFFIRTRSLIAVMLGHFLFNFIQLQLAPLMLKLAEQAQRMQEGGP